MRPADGPPPVAVLPPAPVETHKSKGKSGRPPEHDWAADALRAYVAQHGLPPVRRRLVEVAEEWFVKNDGGKAPHQSDIRKRLVNPLYDGDER